MNNELFLTEARKQEEKLNVRLILKIMGNNGDVYSVFYRIVDDSYIVWTSFKTEGKYNGFYNGSYDHKSMESALKELENRLKTV